jgi:endonuclease/exonuclease/phosphatase family metal-dependent hydrolase
LGQNLRVMSANLMNGGADPDTLASLVESLAVDVLAVQEVSHE